LRPRRRGHQQCAAKNDRQGAHVYGTLIGSK
jgi:hypothetical protein